VWCDHRSSATKQHADRSTQKLGIEQVIMLTGDNRRTAHSIAQAIRVDQVYAELLPEDKLHIIRQLQNNTRLWQWWGMVMMRLRSLKIRWYRNGRYRKRCGSRNRRRRGGRSVREIAAAVKLGRRSHSICQTNITFAISCITLIAVNFQAISLYPVS